MKEKKIAGKCSFCGQEGLVTIVNHVSCACDECLSYAWTRRNPGKSLPESFETIKLAFAN
jgi:hypothetical protein